MKKSVQTAIITVIAVVVATLGAVTTFMSPAGATNDKIAFCHATGSETNPYVFIETSTAAFYNSGHIDHEGDIYPAGSHRDQSWPAQGDQTILANGCVVPEEEPTEPTEEPTPTDEPTPTEEPSAPTETPSTPSETPTTTNPVPTPTETVPSVPTPTETATETPSEEPTPTEDETPDEENPTPDKNNNPPKDKITSSMHCEDGVWVTQMVKNGVVISTSESGTCEVNDTNDEPIFSLQETGL